MSGSYEAEDEFGPPPAPFERPPTPASSRPRRSRVGVVAIVLVAAAVGFIGGFLLSEVLEGAELPWRDTAAEQRERDAELVILLEGIVTAESIMLAFNDVVVEQFEGASEEAAAFAAVASAAATGRDGLQAVRPSLVEPVGDRVVDEVRDAYIPHLDSWIEYLDALARRPEMVFTRDDQQPYLLRINATAEVFADSLVALLATDPAPEVAELAQGILDEGFSSERDADV